MSHTTLADAFYINSVIDSSNERRISKNITVGLFQTFLRSDFTLDFVRGEGQVKPFKVDFSINKPKSVG